MHSNKTLEVVLERSKVPCWLGQQFLDFRRRERIGRLDFRVVERNGDVVWVRNIVSAKSVGPLI